MGYAKNRAMEDEEKLEIATEIAVRARVLARCQQHGYVFIGGNGDITNAYKLANYLITKRDPLVAVFENNRAELTDLVKKVTVYYGLFCPGCKKIAEE